MNRHAISRVVLALAVVTLTACNAATVSPSPVPGTPSPTATATNSPAPATPSPTAEPQATSGTLPPDGTWQVEISAADLAAGGWSPDDLPIGTYTWTFADGLASIEFLAADGGNAYCAADMYAEGGHVRFDYDPVGGDCGDLEEVVDWELADDGLHLFLVSTGSPYVESQRAQLEAKPWQKVEVAVSGVDPGMVDIGGRSLFMECRGSGSPTVIFLTGNQMPRGATRGIQDKLLDEGSVRVCDYDRAGEGRSDQANETQTDLEVVDDLSVLLDAADIRPPYVLVGHSRGGDQTWLYADRHPEGLAGFMLLNAGYFELDWDALEGVLTQAEIDMERTAAEDRQASITQAATPPDGMPYVVMQSTIAQCGSPTDWCGRVYPFHEAWAREIASRTGSGRLVSIDAGHEIYLTELNRVVDEIQVLLDDARSSGAGVPRN